MNKSTPPASIRLKLNMESADRGWLESRREFKGLWSE